MHERLCAMLGTAAYCETRPIYAKLPASMPPAPTPAPIEPSFAFCIEQMAGRGFDPKKVLMNSGLDESSIQNPQTLVSAAQEFAVYRNILQLSRSGSIGLELGRAINRNALGVFGGLLSNAVDLGHAGYLMRRFHPLASPSFRSELMGELAPGKLIVRYKPSRDLGDLYRFIIDRDIRGTQAVLAEIFGPAALESFSTIAFGYPEPKGARRYRSELGCPVSFGHDYSYVVFVKRLDALGNPRRSGIAYNTYMRLCREALARCAPSTWQQKVLNVLSSDESYPKADEMASKLHCSERTLRRRLHEEGFQYSELVDRVRFDRAIYLLTHSRDPVTKIGLQLGYSEPSNFVHAFIRWSGVSPLQFRRTPFAVRIPCGHNEGDGRPRQ